MHKNALKCVWEKTPPLSGKNPTPSASGGGCVCRLFECDARLVTAEVSEAQFHGEIHALKVVPTSNPTSVCADSEAEEREVDELKVEDREVEPPGLPKASSEATGRLPEYGRP